MAGGAFELNSSSSSSQHGAPSSTAERVLDGLQFHSAWVLFLVFAMAFVWYAIVSVEAPATETNKAILLGPGGKPLPGSAKKAKAEREKRKSQLDFSPGRKLVFLYLTITLLGTYVANGINIVVHALSKEHNWWCGEAAAIYVCASAFFYSIFLITLVDSKPSPTIAHQITWILATIVEIVLLAASFSIYTSPHKELNTISEDNNKVYKVPTRWELFELIADVVRLVVLIFSVTFYAIFSMERLFGSSQDSRRGSLDENAPLLVNGLANGNGHIAPNGTIAPAGNSTNGNDTAEPSVNGDNTNLPSSRDDVDDDTPAFYKQKTVPNRTWWEYLRGYSLFFPYLWPAKSVKLQIVVVMCFFIVIAQRVVNLAVPLQIGRVVKALKDEDNPSMPWLDISILIGLKFLQGTSGILGAIRSILWIPISQYSYQALTTASFEHVHQLSLDFHLGKRTGEVISALSKGNAINNFLEQVTFQVLPMIVDLGVAIVYFGIRFDAYYALIVAVITFSYLYLTIRMARWRSEQRRAMTNLSREEEAVKTDSLTSYETVKYFNAEDYEYDRFRKAVVAFQKMEFKVTVSLNVLNISQNMVFMTGLLAASFISAYQVVRGDREVEDFVTLLTYMAQLQQPLNFFGSFYRSVQSAMISGERLLELFKEQPTVVDTYSARDMQACEGQIRFDNVKFAYDERKPALKGLSFNCRPGTTTAFVGESGGGKSTVFRLLFRFYDAQDGSIQLDGNDVKDITIDSLRRHIGVVPQDTVLFNETIMYNLKYANQDATDEQVYDACRAASIHEKIMGFPDKYDTKVGERGLRLSGGEKQRVAIARTILKNPRIIMLDEATAALDSETEQNIQDELTTLSEGRTMLVIAHRLSTVTTADQILVLHAGAVAEAGTHEELLLQKGRYFNMWRKQIRAEEKFAKAAEMIKKAEALQISANNGDPPSESASEDDTDLNSELVPKVLIVSGPHADSSETAGSVSQASEQTAEPYRDAASTLSAGENSGDEDPSPAHIITGAMGAAEGFPPRTQPLPGSSEDESPGGTKPSLKT